MLFWRFAPDIASFFDCSTAGKSENTAATSKLSTLELWQTFFANPTEWWDNRKNKVVQYVLKTSQCLFVFKYFVIVFSVKVIY